MRKILSSLVVMLLSIVATTAVAQDELTRIPVFSKGEAGSTHYRIPALVQTGPDTLVAIADKRGDSIRDLPNIISIVAKTSTDGGQTWDEMVTVAAGDATAGTTFGDAVAVYDEVAKKIVAVFVGNVDYGTNCKGLWDSNSTWPLRLYQSESSDNGKTWTPVKDITESIYNSIYGSQYYWKGMFAGSGSAIQLKNGDKAGRLMFVVAARTNYVSGGPMSNYAVYSDDHGATWQVSPNATYTNGDEAKVVELENGDVLMTIKNRNKGYRLMSRSTDYGVTWSSVEQNTDIMDPACNGDVVSYETADGKYYLLHSMPGSTSTRENVTVYLSADGGETWPISRQIFDGYSAYSTLQVLDDGTIGIIVEEGKWDSSLPGEDVFNLAYYNFTLDWLLNGQEPEIPLAEGVLDLNGSRYMSIANNDAFDIPAGGTAGYTITCKVKVPEYQSGANMRFVCNRAYEGTDNNGTTGFDLYGANSSAQAVSVNLSYDGKPWGNSFAWNTGVTEDAWVHLTWVLDGTTSYLYVDGVLKETKTGMSTLGIPSKADILVGAGYTNVNGAEVVPAYYAKGYIDDVRFWNKALSQTEVVADMSSTVDETTEGLVAAYDFENIVGYEVPDISGNGHTGTLVGFPEEVQYTVTVSANEGGSATVDGEAGPVLIWDGETATLEATANEGYEFAGWIVGSDVVSTDNPYTAEITEDVEFIATFREEGAVEYCTFEGNSSHAQRRLASMTLTNGTDAFAVSSIQPALYSSVYVDKTPVVIEAQPEAIISLTSFDFKGEWMHAYMYIDYNKDGVFSQVTNNDGTTGGELVTYNCYNEKNINGTSANQQYANTRSYTNTYGTSQGLPAFKLPADITKGEYRVRVKTDWNHLDPCGHPSESANPMTVNGGCIVDFTLRVVGGQFTVTVASSDETMGTAYIGTEGTTTDKVSDDGTETVELTAVANQYYEFVNWTLDGEEVSTDAVYTTTAVTEDRDYIANFKLTPIEPRTITVVSSDATKGSVAIVSPETTETSITTGEMVVVEATPASENDFFVNWTIGEEVVGTETSYTYMDAGEATIQANFISRYIFTFSATENGTATVSSSQGGVASGDRVEEGTTIQISATPNYGYEIKSITINGEEQITEPTQEVISFDYVVTSTTDLAVVFEKLSATLTYECIGNGTIEIWTDDVKEGTMYENGASIPLNGDLFIFTYPVEGEELVSLIVNGDVDVTGEIAEYGSAYHMVEGNTNIVATFTATTGIEDATADAAQVYAADGKIYVNGFEGTAQVVNISGQVVKEVAVMGNAQIAMPQGIYFVVTASQVSKVVVK